MWESENLAGAGISTQYCGLLLIYAKLPVHL